MDNQVKVRGYRIELGEIEATLVQCPGVKEAVVATRADRTGENSLVSWIIADSTPPPEIPEIRDFLRRTLPEYMLPTSFLFLEAYPLTPSGKIDRRALPNPDADMVAAHREYTAPRNKTEEIIAGIWREILNVERVGVEDNFFDLGGHSLSASRLIAKVRQTFKLDIPLRSVFIDATVSGLAKQISQSSDMSYQFHESKQTWKYLVPMQPFGPARPFFLVAGAHAEEDEFLRYLSNLIPHIGKDQPVFGFKPRGLDGLEEPPASVEEMAQDYLRELQAFQPQGPYLLGGECVGGVVAFEMARQLIQRGEKVGLLMLLDTRRPTPKMATRFKVEIFNIRLRRMAEKMRRILRLGLSRGGRELLEILKEKRRYHLPMNEKEIREKRIRRLEEIYPRMMFRYLPKPYSERLTLLVNETLYAHNPSIGWEDLAQGGLEIHVVPGNHITRLTQHGKTTARILRQCLDQAQRSVDPESAA
jgi:thioesterase domain-containing protein/acyl carrier protein